MFSIDGIEYNGKCLLENGIERSFSVLDTDKSGRVLTGRMNRDIIGTYYNYTIKILPDGMTDEEYDTLWETLSAPVDSHTFTLPYARGEIHFEGYVTGGKDTLEIINGDNVWKDLSINVVAMEPYRRP